MTRLVFSMTLKDLLIVCFLMSTGCYTFSIQGQIEVQGIIESTFERTTTSKDTITPSVTGSVAGSMPSPSLESATSVHQAPFDAIEA
jgi:hypothetical protein